MEIRSLLHHLKHGYSALITEPDGSQHQELYAPNKYMIRAARVIEACIQDNTRIMQILNQSQNQLQQLLEEKEKSSYETQVQHHGGVSGHESTSGQSSNSPSATPE